MAAVREFGFADCKNLEIFKAPQLQKVGESCFSDMAECLKRGKIPDQMD